MRRSGNRWHRYLFTISLLFAVTSVVTAYSSFGQPIVTYTKIGPIGWITYAIFFAAAAIYLKQER